MWDAAVHIQHTILVVDDDRAIRGWLTDLLSDAGYNVACAANGRDALRHIAQHGTPGLILLDVLMPEMNGFQLLQALHSDCQAAAVPVVMLSAFGPQYVPPCAAKVSAWLVKPVEVEQLLDTVELYRAAMPYGLSMPASA